MKYTITRNSSRGVLRLTTRSLESDRDACAARTSGEQQLVTLFAHVEQSRTFACASIAPAGPFRIASKGPKRADHAAGTDFTRPRHGSCQLSLIEILKCNASLAAAADGNDSRRISPETHRGWGQPGSLLTVEILSRAIINVILCASYNSFFSARYLRMCAIKIGIILLDVCLHSAKPETFTAIRMCVASEARPINVIPARVIRFTFTLVLLNAIYFSL